MPPPAILDPRTLDLSNIIADRDAIGELNLHRHEFALLDAVVYADEENAIFAGYHDVRPDAFWVRGHVPERPLFPGVLMLESAAQLASYMRAKLINQEGFFGLTGVDQVKYRGTVEPPSRYVVVAKGVDVRPRRTRCLAQGFVDGTMVFEAMITGMMV